MINIKSNNEEEDCVIVVIKRPLFILTISTIIITINMLKSFFVAGGEMDLLLLVNST